MQSSPTKQQRTIRFPDDAQLIDCCFTDPLGTWHHCHFDRDMVEKHLTTGLGFDASSIPLFSNIKQSDMVMIPDGHGQALRWRDPFQNNMRVYHVTCSVQFPNGDRFMHDPRSIAVAAERYLKDTGIADKALFGPEPEFFVFDNVQYKISPQQVSHQVNAREAFWNSDTSYPTGNRAHRQRAKSSYFPTAPVDRTVNVRNEMLWTLKEQCFVPIEKHHHEVATCQGELGIKACPLVACADNVQTYKYVVRNVACKHGKTATFMPKPIYGDNGSGMHVHQSLWLNDKPLFYDAQSKYANLSQTCLWYVGGLLQHAPALCAFTNPTTNSYKRLVPGYEAPTRLVYGRSDRSAAIRIPMYSPNSPGATRIEYRVPDATANPYLIFSAMLMAGLDGIQQKMNVRDRCIDADDVYKWTKVPETPASLEEALNALEKDHAFLLKGTVFDEAFIKAYIAYKRKEAKRISMIPHPAEFETYYSL